MECSCIRRTSTKFDFLLELLDCDTLVFTDLSNWMDEDYYVIPDTWPMTIKFPNGKKVEVSFKPQQSTIYKPTDLGVSCLLDGIYCFSTESCGYDYIRNEAILCSLECKLDTLTNTIESNNDVELVKTMTVYMNCIRTNARVGKIQKATKYFNLVSNELEKVDCL